MGIKPRDKSDRKSLGERETLEMQSEMGWGRWMCIMSKL